MVDNSHEKLADNSILIPPKHSQSTEADDESEEDDEAEVLEESPCGRWQKRRQRVTQRDVPGIDAAYLAMDTEEGVEVVWNEVLFSERKSYRPHDAAAIHLVFDNLIQLDHVNIVKLHSYWTDARGLADQPRIVFLTEYMSAGSMRNFLKTTRSQNHKVMHMKTWKRWCTQILSALSYLHSCTPPVLHGNLNCDTLFIQHNGLIKIGSVAPDAIHNHVKTCRDLQRRRLHYVAPEYSTQKPLTTAVDIYAFGMCALEMAVLGINGCEGSSGVISEEFIQRTLDSLENEQQKNFIRACIHPDPDKRPTARELLFHHILFEVHSLKLLAAHAFVSHESLLPDNILELRVQRLEHCKQQQQEFALVNSRRWCYNQLPELEFEKFLEDVKNGVYPLTAFSLHKPSAGISGATRPSSPEPVVVANSPEPLEPECRAMLNINCQLATIEGGKQLQIKLELEDHMHRSLKTLLNESDTPHSLAADLVAYGLLSENDVEKVSECISNSFVCCEA